MEKHFPVPKWAIEQSREDEVIKKQNSRRNTSVFCNRCWKNCKQARRDLCLALSRTLHDVDDEKSNNTIKMREGKNRMNRQSVTNLGIGDKC